MSKWNELYVSGSKRLFADEQGSSICELYLGATWDKIECTSIKKVFKISDRLTIGFIREEEVKALLTCSLPEILEIIFLFFIILMHVLHD